MQPPGSQAARFTTAIGALAAHWPEYLMEAAELGIFMVSACLFTVLLFHPSSPAISAIPNEFSRRLLTGLAMGATAIALVYSPLGARSGAHFNPSVTLAFLRMGRIASWDAFFYICAQFIGSVAGVALASLLLGTRLAHRATNFAVTVPGMPGLRAAAVAEFVIAFILMTVVLSVSTRDKISRFTGIAAGVLVATFITFEAPFSGMSMNPARTFGSAFNAHVWTGIWIYLVVPPIAMLSAAELFLILRERAGCAKLNHAEGVRCIFCEYQNWKSNRFKVQSLATAS
jgi:aquaporin Z